MSQLRKGEIVSGELPRYKLTIKPDIGELPFHELRDAVRAAEILLDQHWITSVIITKRDDHEHQSATRHAADAEGHEPARRTGTTGKT